MNEDNKNRWKIIKPVIPTEKIIEDLKEKVESEIENSNYLRQLAILLYKQKRYDESIPYFKKLLDKGLRDPDILSSYGDVLLEKGRYKEAKTYFKETLNKDSNDPIAQSGMVKIEEIEKQLVKTRKRITKYASIVSAAIISLIIVSIIFTKNPFSFLTPNKLYGAIVAYYQKETYGSVKIISKPDNAEIFVDGKKMAEKTPAEISLKQGSHVIEVAKNGYTNSKKTVQITRKKTQEISFSLELTPGILLINGNPVGAKVYINGEYKGISPINVNLKQGKYKLKVSMEGFKDYTSDIAIESGKTKTISYSLLSSLGTLSISSNPTYASVYINGIFKGTTPLTFSLPAGNYKVTLKKDCYNDYLTTANVYTSKTTNLSLNLKLSEKCKFYYGEYVIATDYVNCRSQPNMKGTVLKEIEMGSQGIIQSSSPIYADGYYWWSVNWIDSPSLGKVSISGWSVGIYLERWPYIGILVQTMTQEIAKASGVQFIEGVYISQVIPDSPAEKVGLKVGDIIVTFDGRRVKSEKEIRLLLAQKRVGDKLEINVVRYGDEILKFSLILEVKQ
jgi:tetratricopeptide (TPR) repeat protein